MQYKRRILMRSILMTLAIMMISLSMFSNVASANTKELIDIICSNPLINTNTASSLRYLAGYSGGKRYLVLFADSSEPRSVCGFTGWYAIVLMKNGEFSVESISNEVSAIGRTYDLDVMMPSAKRSLAPLPVNTSCKWLTLRDSMIWPDFPYNALLTKKMYDIEVNSGLPWRPYLPQFDVPTGPWSSITWPSRFKKIDGIVLVSQEALKEYLKMTGSITVNKNLQYLGASTRVSEVFRYDNLDFLLNYYSNGNGFWNSMIGSGGVQFVYPLFEELYDVVIARLNTSDSTKRLSFANYLLRMVNRKNIIIYSYNSTVENTLKYLGWAGELKQNNGNYVGVFDAGHGSYISRVYTSRAIRHTVSVNSVGVPIAKTEVIMTNKGKMPLTDARAKIFNGMTYKAYVRLYVPYGSKYRDSSFISRLFVDTNLQDQKPAYPNHLGPHIANQFGKTFLAGWAKVPPGVKKNLWFKYSLPKSVVKVSGRKRSISTLFQKQAGLRAEYVYFNFYIPSTTRLVSTSIKPYRRERNVIYFRFNSSVDKNVKIVYSY